MFWILSLLWLPLASSLVTPCHYGMLRPGRVGETTVSSSPSSVVSPPSFRPELTTLSSSTSNDWVEFLQPKSKISSIFSKLKLQYRILRFAALRRQLQLQKKQAASRRRATTQSDSVTKSSSSVVIKKDSKEVSNIDKPSISFEETPMRSAVKSLLWRLLAGSVTFVTSYRFSGGSLGQAMSIVSSDFLSKVVTMFLGERLFNRHSAGRTATTESAKRSFLKALIWRLFAIVNTLTVAVFVSKDLSVAGQIAGSDALVKAAMMFAYERVWTTIQWGKKATTIGGDDIMGVEPPRPQEAH